MARIAKRAAPQLMADMLTLALLAVALYLLWRFPPPPPPAV